MYKFISTLALALGCVSAAAQAEALPPIKVVYHVNTDVDTVHAILRTSATT